MDKRADAADEGEHITLKGVGLTLDCGVVLDDVTLAYRSYGTLNAKKSNAILICHALTGDQHPYGNNPLTGKTGWWDAIIGPGKPVDPDDYFIICANVIGGCGGSSGPQTLKPDGSEPYGLDFPVITIADMVRAQNLLIDCLFVPDLALSLPKLDVCRAHI